MYAFVGFLLGLGLSYVVFPYPTPGPGDDKGVERFVVTAIVAGLAYGLGKLVQDTQNQTRTPGSSPDPLPTPPAAPTGEGARRSDAQEIRELADLHEAGILTDEEFEAKKRQILGL